MKKEELTKKIQEIRKDLIETINQYIIEFGENESIEFNRCLSFGKNLNNYGVKIINGNVYVDRHSGDLEGLRNPDLPINAYSLDQIIEICKYLEDANKTLEYQVGDVIQFGAKKAEVVQSSTGCRECIFEDLCVDADVGIMHKFIGECEVSRRKTDLTDVIFKEIKEDE